MKNLSIGLILGVIVTFIGMMIFKQADSPAVSKFEAKESNEVLVVHHDSSDEIEIKQPVKIRDISKTVITSVADRVSTDLTDIENLSSAELKDLVRNYQSQISGLVSKVKAQQQAIETLNDEQERRRNPLEEQNLSPEQATAALANIQAALQTADPEYKEVLESALNLFADDELQTPTNDALLRHYSDEPNVQWAPSAQAWLQSYFQSGLEPDMTLIQLNCRATYCELYGFYGSDTTIADYRGPAAKISNFFRQMSDGSGYKSLFRSAENISLNTSSDNTFMSFHVFIRSIN